MITQFVEIYMNNKSVLEEQFKEKHPGDYKEIVEMVMQLIADSFEKYEDTFYDLNLDVPDVRNIHEIDDGDYQGTLLYMIPFDTYQPSSYYYVFVFYGSCSGCDTLQAIHEDSDELPNEAQIKDYMTLALHIMQDIKFISAY